ncbi:MAG TPA: class I SAM-dependent methyltransferase [Dehalococcoidia bacterium]|nr:class I SAM-dependent methyltransferase [Dehalococcoidia bacterium]
MPYEPEFARVYDVVVHQTEESLAGDTEMDFLRWAFDQCPRDVRDILDVGCGKGRHLVPLVEAGYQVTGFDQSPDMLATCNQRLQQRGLSARFLRADLDTLDVDQGYDALLCLDSVLSYFLETDRIITTLSRFRRALRPRGMLILDIWNILAEWPQFGQTMPYAYESETLRVNWQERYEYQDFTSLLRATYLGHFVEHGVTQEFRHEEILRAMTVGEMQMYLKAAGFERIAAYPSFDRSEFDSVTAEVLVFVALRP